MLKSQAEPPINSRQWLQDALSQEAEIQSVTIEGARVNCRTWRADRSDLPCIILVHGFRAHARWWDHIAPLLCAEHRIAALDLTGMGDSDRRPAYSRAQHGREVLGVAEALGFVSPIIIGHSYGGVTSLMACKAVPERVRHLILIDSALPTKDEGHHVIPSQALRFYPSREAGIERFRLSPPGAWPDPEILSHIAYHSLRETPSGWTWKFDHSFDATLNRDPDYREAMLGATLPCDYVYGDLSEIATPERRREIPLMMPSAGAPVAIPASHHHVMLEQPLALVAVLRTLIGRRASIKQDLLF